MNRAVRNLSELNVSTDRYSIIILASSSSLRMKSYGARSLLPLTDKIHVIDRQIELLSRTFPKAEFVLVTGFEADKLMNYTPNWIIKVENEKYTEIETIRSLALGLRACTREFVIFLNGNVVFNKETVRSLGPKSSLVLTENINFGNVGCYVTENVIENVHYDLKEIWTGIASFGGKELQLLKNFCWNRQKDNLLLFEALNEIIERGGRLEANRPVGINGIAIESISELEIAQKIK